MPRGKKHAPAASETEAEAVGRLADAIEGIEHELRILREVLDEVRKDLQSLLKVKPSLPSRHVVQVTRIPHPGSPAPAAPISGLARSGPQNLPAAPLESPIAQLKKQQSLFPLEDRPPKP